MIFLKSGAKKNKPDIKNKTNRMSHMNHMNK